MEFWRDTALHDQFYALIDRKTGQRTLAFSILRRTERASMSPPQKLQVWQHAYNVQLPRLKTNNYCVKYLNDKKSLLCPPVLSLITLAIPLKKRVRSMHWRCR